MKLLFKTFCIGLVACLASTYAVAANKVVYRWKDENGAVHYSPQKPWGVEYETVDTSYSAKQRELIEEIKQQKAEYDLITNKDKIKAEEEKKRKELKQRLEICVDSTYDKMSYQIRRIETDTLKIRQACEYQYHQDNKNDVYLACLQKAEDERQSKLKLLENSVNYCITDDTPPDVIYEVMKKQRDKLKLNYDMKPIEKLSSDLDKK